MAELVFNPTPFFELIRDGKEPCMLFTTWQAPPIGYYVSEWMADGVRCIWTGLKLLSRAGKQIHAPYWFTSGLPAYALDGDLWMGRGVAMSNKLHSLIQSNHWTQPIVDSPWLQVKFMISDVPILNVPFEQRCDTFLKHQRTHFGLHAFLVRSIILNSKAHFDELYRKIKTEGGLGVIARKPNSLYTFKRSPDVLKIPFWYIGVAQIQEIENTVCRCYTEEGLEILVPLFKNAAKDKQFLFKCYGRTIEGLPRGPSFTTFNLNDHLPYIPPVFKGEFTTRVPKMWLGIW